MAVQIVIETTEDRPGVFRADGYLADGGMRPRWLRQLVETGKTREEAVERLTDRILDTGRVQGIALTHAAL